VPTDIGDRGAGLGQTRGAGDVIFVWRDVFVASLSLEGNTDTDPALVFSGRELLGQHQQERVLTLL